MIRVTAEICEGALTQRQQITAPSIEQALKMAREGKPGRRVHLLFPIDSKAFFVPESPHSKEGGLRCNTRASTT
jgi:hypothetical protein